MTTLFHFTAVRLSPGSLIKPGNWGRILRRYQHKSVTGQLFGNPWVVARELAFEMARREVAPRAPSRLECCYAVPSLDAAQRYREANDPHLIQVLHRVRIADPEAPKHEGALAFLNWPQQAVFLEPTLDLARRYWAGEAAGDTEILTSSPLEVVECLE